MRFTDIRRHLVEYGIYRSRKTTINHAFAAAIAPCDDYDPERIKNAIRMLNQDPESPLKCAYCDSDAETWDHVFATVRHSEFSGAGHRLGNLLPCCKPCNSKKGNKHWKDYVLRRAEDELHKASRIKTIEAYLAAHFLPDALPEDSPQYTELRQIRGDILALMQKADELASVIRAEMKTKS